VRLSRHFRNVIPDSRDIKVGVPAVPLSLLYHTTPVIPLEPLIFFTTVRNIFMGSIPPVATMSADPEPMRGTLMKLRDLRTKMETHDYLHNACFKEETPCIEIHLEGMIKELDSIRTFLVADTQPAPAMPTKDVFQKRYETIREKMEVIKEILRTLYVHALNQLSCSPLTENPGKIRAHCSTQS
jgi:hypothetical protein